MGSWGSQFGRSIRRGAFVKLMPVIGGGVPVIPGRFAATIDPCVANRLPMSAVIFSMPASAP